MTTFTANTGLVVDPTGSNVGTWADNVTNVDYIAIDGFIGGVQSVSLSNVPVTLSAPATFTATPGGGPYQSQNRVLRFTGTLTADVTVTLPMPASYIVENLTTGAFDVTLRGATAATEVIAIPQGESVEIYNDGSRVRFMGLGRMGEMSHWAGLTSMPSWVGKCTVKPYLMCDDTVYNVSDYPYLGARFLGKFGGNGVTTFANPDMRGRVPLAYDGSANRITTAGCGIDGDTIGSAGGSQNITLAANQIPSITSVNAAQSISVSSSGNHIPTATTTWQVANLTGGSGVKVSQYTGNLVDVTSLSGDNSISVTYTNASQQASIVVQPSIVTGIWVVKT